MKHILLTITIAFALTACGEPDPHDLVVDEKELLNSDFTVNEANMLKYRKICYPDSLEEFESWFCEDGCPGYPKCVYPLGLKDKILKDKRSGWTMKYEWK